MQAENALDQMDWIEKITGVIASLLSFQTPERVIVQLGILKNIQPFSCYNAYNQLFGSVSRLALREVMIRSLEVRVIY